MKICLLGRTECEATKQANRDFLRGLFVLTLLVFGVEFFFYTSTTKRRGDS